MTKRGWEDAWLEAVSRLGDDVRQVYLRIEDPLRGSGAVSCAWPAVASASQLSMLVDLAAEAVSGRGPVVRASPRRNRPATAVALPLDRADKKDRGCGVLSVLLDRPAGVDGGVESKRALDRARQLAAASEIVVRHAQARARLRTTLSALASVLEWRDCRAAATAIATELAVALDCHRVSLGFRVHDDVELEAVSNAASPDKRSRWAEMLVTAMAEACDQDRSVAAPLGADVARVANLAHVRICEGEGTGSVFTVPFAVEGRVAGAFTFEQTTTDPPSGPRIELCEDLVALVGPALELRRRVRDSIWRRLGAAMGVGPSTGNRRARNRRVMLLAALAALAFSLLPGDFRVTARATLEGRVQRAVTAGIEGFLAESNARPGDLVRKGALLARFEDRDLVVEQRNWVARREQLRRRYRDAIARGDRSEASVLDAQSAQARAEIELIEARLDRTRVLAPFDGVIVEGDWSQSLGAPIERGALLFEVAPLDGYRIVLDVDERDIAHVKVGQRGSLGLSAFPGVAFPLEIRRVMPVSISGDGRTYFRVEADLEHPARALRPGMEGVAKVHVGEHQRLWIWIRPIVDAARLAFWRVSW